MKTIPLSQGKMALVDDNDYEWLKRWSWHILLSGSHHVLYATRLIRVAKNKQRNQLMHRLILRLKPGDKRQCDHRDGNGLNNVRSNLRVCTAGQNCRSSRKRIISSSKYKGVSWHLRDHKWYSKIRVNKKDIHIGSFGLEIEAAQAYDAAALKHHRDFALTNEMLGLFR